MDAPRVDSGHVTTISNNFGMMSENSQLSELCLGVVMLHEKKADSNHIVPHVVVDLTNTFSTNRCAIIDKTLRFTGASHGGYNLLVFHRDLFI